MYRMQKKNIYIIYIILIFQNNQINIMRLSTVPTGDYFFDKILSKKILLEWGRGGAARAVSIILKPLSALRIFTAESCKINLSHTPL